MKKVLIAHFSQSGTTARVAQHIASGFDKKKYTTTLHRIQDREQIDVNKFDIIGIGFPVYIFRMPFLVREFIENLPNLNGKPFFVFVLYGTLRGTAANSARKLLEHKGGTEAGYSHYTGDDVYVGYLRRGYLFSPGHPMQKDLDRASSFAGEINKVLNGGHYTKPPYDSGPGAVFTLERMLTVKPLINNFYRFFFTVDKKKCNQCGLCIKNCPSNNITKNSKGYPKFGSKCICCWYCDMKCPQEAISTPLNWPLMSLFNSYNINKTLKDPAIDYVKVKLSKGRVERV